MARLILVITICLLTTIFCLAGQLKFSEFHLITNYEQTILGESVKFFNGDTISGWLHSNDQIAIMQSPVFYGPVTTCARDFWQGPAYNPIFYQEPIFNYPQAVFPDSLTEIRTVAQMQGGFFSAPGYQFRLLFLGANGYHLLKWPLGLPYSDTLAVIVYASPPLYGGVFFIDDPLEILGTEPESRIDYGFEGQLAVGCSQNIFILDNLRYVDSDLLNGMVNLGTTNCLGLCSEANIIIANTWENGRDNGTVSTSEWKKDVIINGAILTLGESFTFQDQNDALGGNLPWWYYSNGPTPDERGQIHLWGSLAQYRRGYVHRSNHYGTGYLKDYHYYNGLAQNPPPYFPYLPVDMTFSDEVLDFSEVEVGDTASQSLWAYNFCMDSINIESWGFSDPSFSGVLSGDSLLCANDSTMMNVYFHPQSAVEFEEQLTFFTDQGDYSIELIGEGTGTKINDEPTSVLLRDFNLLVARPNPFNHEVTIEFSVKSPKIVWISISDIDGREIYLNSYSCVSGINRIYWEPDDIASGLYLFHLQSNNSSAYGKLLYLK